MPENGGNGPMGKKAGPVVIMQYTATVIEL